MNKKIKCPKCGWKDLWHEYKDHYQCGMCGYCMTFDGYQYIEPPRQSYICPRCGKWWDYLDDEDHMCKNCHYKVMTKTEFSAKDYMNAYNTSPEALRQFKQNLREKYTVNSPQFDKQLYEDLLTKEYKDSLEREATELRRQQEIALNKNKIHCPKCNSTNVTTGQRGYSFWTGFLGSSKTVNRCGNCGYKWKP